MYDVNFTEEALTTIASIYGPMIIGLIHRTFREGFKKKKVTNLGHCPNRGGGGPTPRIERPNLLMWSDTKNWPKLFSQPKVEKKIFFSKGCTKIRLFYLSAKMLCIQDVWTRNHIFSLFLPSLIPYQSTPWQPILGAHNLTMWPSAHNLTLQWMGPNPWQAQPNPMLHEI